MTPTSHLRIQRRGLQLHVSEQHLNDPDVDLLLQQVRGEAVSQCVRRADTALPTLRSLLIKSTLLGGMGGRNELREGDDLHLNPPMRHFGFLDWNAIYGLVDVGYRYTQERLPAWLERNPRLQRP